MINKERIRLLPIWNITEPHPAFYDIDSKTSVGQTARLYGAMRELQEDYNKYVNEINATITAFINDVNADQEEFINSINKIMHDYIAMLDEKIKMQDEVIDENITYIKENMIESLQELLNQMVESGKLDAIILNTFNELNDRVETLEKTKTVTTIDEMKSLSELALGMIIQTIGYYSVNDGGGATYIIREKLETDIEDNAFIHFINNSLVAEMIVYNNMVNIKQLGGKGDKSNDVSNIIEISDSKGINIFFERGNYLLSNPIEINNIDLICDVDGYIFPDFTDDVIKIKSMFHKYQLNIDGSLQPIIDKSKSAIVIGYEGHNSRHTELTNSKIKNMKSMGIKWEHGAFADFTNVYISNCEGYGIYCTENYIDNNHGIFRDTEIINGKDTALYIPNGATEEASSRHHIFSNFKVYNCTLGFEIGTHSNFGTVFLEQNKYTDENGNIVRTSGKLTSTSHGNKIEIINTVILWSNFVDEGKGNLVCGYSGYGYYNHKNLLTESLKIHKEGKIGRLLFHQINDNEIIDEITDSTKATRVIHSKGTATNRIDEFDGIVKIRDFKFSTAKTGVVECSGSVLPGEYKNFSVTSALSFASINPIPTIFTTLALPNEFETSNEVFLETFMKGTAIILKVVNKSNSEISLDGAKIRWTCINHY